MSTETLDKLYLEWSHFTSARSQRERTMRDALELAEKALENGDTEIIERARIEIARALMVYRIGSNKKAAIT